MKRRSQKLEILFDIQAVSCPGVWIPCNGAVYVSICLLGHYIRTKDTAPVFPMKFGEKYLVEKVFSHVFRLGDLDDVLDAEVVYIELIQKFLERPDTVLATFETSARELLFPNDNTTPQYSGADLDLLMEPTVHFVGTLVPRLEISTKTTVKEVRTSLPQAPASRSGSAIRAPVAVPKTMRGRQPGERPPFRWRRADPSLLSRQNWAPPGRRQPRKRWRSLTPGPSAAGRHCHCSCPQKSVACQDQLRPGRSASVPRLRQGGGGSESGTLLTQPPSSSGGPGALGRTRSVEPLNVHVNETPGKPGWCGHCGTRHTVHSCSVCEAYRRYFGRDYPGHYHHDCCDCHCPVTTEGVRHLCGQTQRSRANVPGKPNAGCRADSDTNLAQVWEDFVETSSPRKNDTRHEFYQRLEDFYRKMYTHASHRAFQGLMQADNG